MKTDLGTDIKMKWKLFLYFLLFVFVMIVTLWLLQTVFLSDFYKAIKTQEIKIIAKHIEKNIDNPELTVLLTRFARRDNGLNVLIYGEDGQIIFRPGMAGETSDFRPLPPEAPHAIKDLIDKVKKEGNVSVYQENDNAFGNMEELSNSGRFFERLVIGRPARAENIVNISETVNKDNEKIYIMISALITPVDATVTTLRYQLVLVSIILMLFAVALSLIISRKFAQPIMEINEVAKQLTVGNYDVTFNARGYTEINELNHTLNKAAFELSRVENLRRELLANVSHDLRTPLTMITGFAEMIRDLPGENSPENAQIIIDESNRLTRLVSDLLDISQLEAGGGALEFSVFSLTELIRKTAERMEGLSAASNERRIIVEADSDVEVNANESQITQVIYNLIANALNYSDGDIKIKQSINANIVRIEVCDSGNGISEAELPYVWERYYKAAGHHKRANIGTGLGLSIVRSVIERHGGTYGVNSNEGEGSIFWFEIEIA